MFVKVYYINLLWPHGLRHVLSFTTLNIILHLHYFMQADALKWLLPNPKNPTKRPQHRSSSMENRKL